MYTRRYVHTQAYSYHLITYVPSVSRQMKNTNSGHSRYLLIVVAVILNYSTPPSASPWKTEKSGEVPSKVAIYCCYKLWISHTFQQCRKAVQSLVAGLLAVGSNPHALSPPLCTERDGLSTSFTHPALGWDPRKRHSGVGLESPTLRPMGGCISSFLGARRISWRRLLPLHPGRTSTRPGDRRVAGGRAAWGDRSPPAHPPLPATHRLAAQTVSSDFQSQSARSDFALLRHK